jgi:hypothetical protein
MNFHSWPGMLLARVKQIWSSMLNPQWRKDSSTLSRMYNGTPVYIHILDGIYHAHVVVGFLKGVQRMI